MYTLYKLLDMAIFPWQVTCISTAEALYSCADARDLPREDGYGQKRSN